MNFTDDTYLALDVPPSKWTEHISSVRRRLDAGRAALPIEVTITGSAGVGPFHEEQNQPAAFRIIDTLASEVRPIKTQFRSVDRFPVSEVFYFKPADAEPFINLQHRIIATGLEFKPSPFSFVPHCTIASLKNNLSDEAVSEIYGLPASEEVLLEVLSFYALNHSGCHLLHRTKLRGKQDL